MTETSFDRELLQWVSIRNAFIVTDELEYTYIIKGRFNRKTRASLAQLCQRWHREVELLAKHTYAVNMLLNIRGGEGASVTLPSFNEDDLPF